MTIICELGPFSGSTPAPLAREPRTSRHETENSRTRRASCVLVTIVLIAHASRLLLVGPVSYSTLYPCRRFDSDGVSDYPPGGNGRAPSTGTPGGVKEYEARDDGHGTYMSGAGSLSLQPYIT